MPRRCGRPGPRIRLLLQEGRVEAKNPAPTWVPKERAEPAAQPATAPIEGGSLL
jgi:hypothetical protein